MAADFTYIPTLVVPVAPKYVVEISQTESYKKEYLLHDTTVLQKFRLYFDGVLDATRNLIYAHYKSAYGPYDAFSWTTVPAYLNEGSTMTARYVLGAYRETPEPRSWDIVLTIEKDIP